MQRETAEKIHGVMNDVSLLLEDLLKEVRDELTEQEKVDFSAAVRDILGIILLDIKTPLYKQQPELIPESLQDLFE